MTLVLESEEIDRLAHEITTLTGESVDDAVRKALAERLDRERERRQAQSVRAEKMLEIARRYAALPVLDPRSPDEIVGYDETGMWR
ncbi:MAG TPA: type II toxin-antitoxin system VapB family antitoxin [Acetobacteraceae bacterium]|nr:type II toxin-antitoxin system VapB family antitoxin [Acetobacteraceae bacterium]